MPSVWGHLQIWVQTLHSSWNWARSKIGRGLSEISRTYGTVRLVHVFSLVRYGWYMCFPNFLWLNHVKYRKMPAKKYHVSIYASRYSSIKYLNMLWIQYLMGVLSFRYPHHVVCCWQDIYRVKHPHWIPLTGWFHSHFLAKFRHMMYNDS